ncbi:helix-turn-helix domain-containing protein [Ideonella sp. B508-1]|uniref:helix-turn-helix domain-containing protein n=1 Tax=Ideonella sp. B508-1 TaxID=137716 RepID=UPI00034C19F0|nr:helix-turn-helix domain-containing protein [Ideonella sp. B508-1]
MSQQLPTYPLYADTRGIGPLDVMHWESIAERSQLHDWEIRPHRHESLLQVLLIEQGEAEVWLDGLQQQVRGPALVVVVPLCAHGFRWAPDVQGHVLTLQAGHARSLLEREPALAEAVLRSGCQLLDGPSCAGLQAALQALLEEYRRHAPWRATAIDAALLRLLVTLCRARPVAPVLPAGQGGRALAQVQQLQELVEQRFRSQPSVADLAACIGITPTQLNRVCRKVLGHSALAVLHARLSLEAQRELAYTTLSVKQVALGLGFADAGYFSRFFQRATGYTPSAWRASRR